MPEATHYVTLTVSVAGEAAWSYVWNRLNDTMCSPGLYDRVLSASVSSTFAEPEEDEDLGFDRSYETHTEETLFKVAVGLREAGLSEDEIQHAISSMQNNGILFRERVK